MKTKTTFKVITSSFLAAGLLSTTAMARNNDFTEFSQVQKNPEGAADIRGQASINSAERKVSGTKLDADVQSYGVDMLTKVSALPGLNLGLSIQQNESEADLSSEAGAVQGKASFTGENLETKGTASYQMPLGETNLRLGYSIIQNGETDEQKVSITNGAGLAVSESSKDELSFLQHQISAAVDVEKFTIGVDYLTSADDENKDKSVEYKPSVIDLFGRVALTDSVALGAVVSQHNFDNLEASDKDSYRNFQGLQLAATYKQDQLMAQARLATKGSESKEEKDYQYWQTDAYVGYKLMPKLELGGTVSYINESFKDESANDVEVKTSGLGFGLEATYSI